MAKPHVTLSSSTPGTVLFTTATHESLGDIHTEVSFFLFSPCPLQTSKTLQILSQVKVLVTQSCLTLCVLKSPTIIVDLSISFCNSIMFYGLGPGKALEIQDLLALHSAALQPPSCTWNYFWTKVRYQPPWARSLWEKCFQNVALLFDLKIFSKW